MSSPSQPLTDKTHPMQARQVPVQRGWAWLQEGLLLWRRNPALLTFASFGYLLILVVVSSVPLIGQPVASLLMPVFSLGVLNTCRAIDEGRKGGPEMLFSGFKTNVQALVTIGGIYLVGSVLVLLFTSLLDGGTLMRLMTGAQELDPETGAVPGLSFTLLVATALSAPVVMAYWFAPILAGWWNVPATKAMFFSFYACLQNWRPFLTYGLAIAIFGALLPGLLIGTVGIAIPFLSTLLVLLLPLILVPVLFASFYANARDVFGTRAVDERPAS